MSVVHPSSLGVRLIPMNNFEPEESGEWGVGRDTINRVSIGEWGDEGAGGEELITNAQNTMPKTQLLLYLVPIIGFFPSLWTLYRGQGSREQLAISRLSITLAFTWLLVYLLFSTGAATSDFFPLRLFILNSFLTSGYFLVSVWLILRLMQGKSGRLPGFSNLAERVIGKYLS
jgi:hypothetical protein